jgi:hypothetical protein
MIPENSSPAVEITTTNEDFYFWSARDCVPCAQRDEIAHSDILIVPELYNTDGATKEWVFPVGTRELVKTVRERSLKRTVVCSDPAHYRELARHGELLVIGAFVVTSLVAPILVNIVSEVINEHLRKKRIQDAEVRIEITVVQETTSRRLRYSGPAKLVDQTLRNNLLLDTEKATQNHSKSQV